MSYTLNLLKNKKVVIIGGSSGIGLSIAAGALAQGAHVVVSSSSQKKVDAAVAELKTSSENVVSGVALNVKNFDRLKAFLDEVGPFDHFVWTAADALQAGWPNIDIQSSKDFFEVRYWSMLTAVQHIQLNKLIRPGGSITLTIGSVFHKPIAGWSLISGVAGACEASTRGLALDLKPVRVNTVSPGYVDTGLWDPMGLEAKEAFFDPIRKRLPLGRIAAPEEIAEAYLFAMKCTYLTGQVINVEGGEFLV